MSQKDVCSLGTQTSLPIPDKRTEPWLTTPELAIQRVRERVAAGGHDVPEQAIRRRFRAGVCNFFQLYRPLASYWFFYDNTDLGGPRLIAHGGADRAEAILVPDAWLRVKAQVEDAR